MPDRDFSKKIHTFLRQTWILTKKSFLFYAKPGFYRKNHLFFTPNQDFNKKIFTFLRQTGILIKKS